jgi:hypothetical protein
MDMVKAINNMIVYKYEGNMGLHICLGINMIEMMLMGNIMTIYTMCTSDSSVVNDVLLDTLIYCAASTRRPLMNEA